MICACVCVLHDKIKTPDWNDLKLGTVAVFDNVSKLIDFVSKRSMVGAHFELLDSFMSVE